MQKSVSYKAPPEFSICAEHTRDKASIESKVIAVTFLQSGQDPHFDVPFEIEVVVFPSRRFGDFAWPDNGQTMVRRWVTELTEKGYLGAMEIELPESFQAEEAKVIAEVCFRTLQRVSKILPLADFKIRFTVDEQQTIPEFGIGGFCGNAHQIEIALSPGRLRDWEKHLPRTIAHEWHHLARWKGPGYGSTLAEAIISEGLAQHFEVECFSGPPPFYSIVLREPERTNIVSKFNSEASSSAYDHDRWFFGRGEFPFLAGYDLSFTVIAEYLNRKTTKASKEVLLSPDQLFDMDLK